MGCDVSVAGSYGALVTNDSLQVLIRKNAKSDAGLFFRWKYAPGVEPELLVRSNLECEFGVSAELILGPLEISSIKGGSVANFLLRYTAGDIEAAGLHWISLNAAWVVVNGLDDHELFCAEAGSLRVLDKWIRSQWRKIDLKRFSIKQRKMFDSFDALCESVRLREMLCGDAYDMSGTGFYSEYIFDVIQSSFSRMGAKHDLAFYIRDVCERALKPGRSEAREKALVEAIHSCLALAYLDFIENKYNNHVEKYEFAKFLFHRLSKVYKWESSAIRRRAIKGGYARWQNYDKVGRARSNQVKADNDKLVNEAILKVLDEKELYRKTDRADAIARKIANAVRSEAVALGVANELLGSELQRYIWDFLCENKAARDRLK